MDKKIQTIFEQDIDGSNKKGVLGIDAAGHLFWNGKRVITARVLKLEWWVNASVILGGLSTAVIAVFTCLLYFKQC
jgi:hypothetical protein